MTLNRSRAIDLDFSTATDPAFSAAGLPKIDFILLTKKDIVPFLNVPVYFFQYVTIDKKKKKYCRNQLLLSWCQMSNNEILQCAF
mmetsp:Transcript_2272/g.3115  ORF Transcript_2272/g.3115 Transcript_2272/m.3115 type:complete len:85 (+) Transcript_2272:511-765(+)